MEHEEQEDRLSNLPQPILHDILSRLPHKYAARTILLSKAWAQTWCTFPFLSFSDAKIIRNHPVVDCSRKRKNFIESEDLLRQRKEFLDYVERTLLRFRDQGLAIKQFNLTVNCFDLCNLSKDIDLWLKLASERGVEVLKLYNREVEAHHQCYILPMSVLETKLLTKLVLTNRIGIDLAFTNHSMKFFSLQVLSLEGVLLGDEQAFKHLISRCPFIEYITLKWCFLLNPGGEWRLEPVEHFRNSHSRLKSLCMCGLPRLKGVDVRGIHEVCVDSHCLESLCYCPGSGPLHAPVKIDFNRCRNLRKLSLRSLRSTIITNKWFLELFAKFPFLESLILQNCPMSEGINISSVQLKVLDLSDCFNRKEVNIDAPNLLSFACAYEGRRTAKSISFLRYSSQLRVVVLVYISNVDFYKLREFIENFKPQTLLASISVLICQPVADALNPGILQVSSLPPSIKHLSVRVAPTDESLYFPLVYRILSSCFPTTISMNCSRAFIEFFYETLMGRKENECFCSSGHIKCWWHGLKGVKLTSSMKIAENVDFKTMLDLLQTSTAWDYISFNLEF